MSRKDLFGARTTPSFGISQDHQAFGLTNPEDPQGLKAFFAPNIGCNPATPTNLKNIASSSEIGFGGQEPEWPPWAKKSGCGPMSILSLNERSYNLSGLVSPTNTWYLGDCMEKKGKTPGGISPDEYEAWLACKKHLMEEKYDIVVNPKLTYPKEPKPGDPFYPYPYDVSEVGCPPLCKQQIITIAFRVFKKVYEWEHSNIPFMSGIKHAASHWVNHFMTCEVVSCDPPDISQGVCLECADVGAQKGITATMCLDKEGNITSLNAELEWGDNIGPPGSCREKMKNPSYRQKHQGAENMNSETLPNYCFEQAKPGTKSVDPGWEFIGALGNWPTLVPKPEVQVVITEVECPEEPEEKEEGK